MKTAIHILTFLIAGTCYAQQTTTIPKSTTGSNTLLWEISGNGLNKPSYIFGTFHLLCKDDIYFSDNLKAAIRNADTMYLEIKMDDPAVMLGGMMYMTMKDGKTLKDLYTDEEYNRLQSFFADSLKMPFMMFQKMKPYFLVSLFYPMMLNCPSPSGVEMELIKIFKADKKPVKGLETIQFQASVFDRIPYEWQAKELIKNIDSTEQMKKEFSHMLDLYKKQQLDSIEILTKAGVTGEEYEDILLVDRNKNWVDQLDKIMHTGSVFVAVGSGHLPGQEGLLTLLKNKGYVVTPLQNE